MMGGRRTRAQRRNFPRRRVTTLRASTRRSTSSRRRVSSKGSARGARLAGKNTPRRTGGRRTTKRGFTPKRSRSVSARSRGRARGTGRTRLSAETTTNHDIIREWAEERGGVPATVARTARRGGAGILRIDFPGFSGVGTLNEISWDEWFQKFDKNHLAFLYQDRTAGGQPSRFFKLVKRSQSRRGR